MEGSARSPSAPAASQQGRQDSPKTASGDVWQKVSFTAKAAAADEESPFQADAGAYIVLEAKGDWWHAGYHLCSAIVGAPLLSLPLAISYLGWYAGVVMLVACGAVSMYAYKLFSDVLDRSAAEGHRLIRYRDAAQHILGKSWAFYAVAFAQLLLCFLSASGLILFAGLFLKDIYKLFRPEGDMHLYQFIIIFGVFTMILAQLPSFHSLRHVNFAATVLTLTFSAIALGGSLYVGHSSSPPAKDYTFAKSGISKTFNVFLSISIITTTYGNAILPETQATIAPPVAGKMLKGLALCYSIVWTTYLSVGISGYWAFGNQVSGNLLQDLSPRLPRWIALTGNICAAAQLTSSTVVYLQPCFELIEGKSADATQGSFSLRNLVPRLVLRSSFVAITTLIAAMFPFIQDLIAILGAFGFIPMDYILPFIFHIIVFRPPWRTLQYWLQCMLAAIFSVISVVAAVGALRQLIIDASAYKLFADV